MKGLGETQRQKSRPREDHRDADSAQDACATEEKAKLWGKWHRHSCLCAVHEAWDSAPGKPRGIACPLLIYGTAIKTPRKPFNYSNLKNFNRR
jgi:hypothetical protein